MAWAVMLIALISGGCGAKTTQTAARADAPQTFPPLTFTPPTIERHTLDNGMKIYFLPDHELPVISMSALIRTGSIYEPAEKIGLAAMTAEVMRTGGTKTHTSDEINEILEFSAASVGMEIDNESGSASLWTLNKNLDAGLDIFADMLRQPVFEPDKFELAKSHALEGIRRRNDSPEEIRSREFMRLLYGKMHPLARIPQPQTVNAITRDDLIAFHQTYFHPNNIMLAVTGDFESGDMLAKLTAAFGDWPSAEIAFPPVELVKLEFSPAVALIDKEGEQTNLAIGHLGLKADNPDYPAVRVMDLILGSGGFSSRLFQKVRTERGLAYAVGSYFGAGTRDYEAFLIFCGTRNDAVQETIQVICGELQALVTTAVSDREVESAKNQYLNSYIFKIATVDDIINRAMFYEYAGYPPDFLETFRQRLMAVTAADVLRVAKLYLHPDALKILAVGSRSQIADAFAAFGAVQDIPLEPVE